MSNDTCPSCGEAVEDADLKFCTSCGLRLAPDDSVDPPQQAASMGGEGEGLIRRTRTSPFLPPPLLDEEDTPVISRAWAVQGARPKGQLLRERKMAGGLPAWEPVPPGEVLVKRAKRT